MPPPQPKIITHPDKVGALFFLMISISYGLYAFKIPLTLLSQQETFNARTMPFALSIIGTLISTMIIFISPQKIKRENSIQVVFKGLDFPKVFQMIAIMIFYSIAITWIGFIISSILFLVAGFSILGEKRVKVLLLASIPLVIGIWLLMSKILGMYIAPGEIFYIMGVLK